MLKLLLEKVKFEKLGKCSPKHALVMKFQFATVVQMRC